MADSWRRPDYDWGRRTSHPNSVWRKEPSPTHPPGPLRSNTMDASRDPRRKRVPSRSPEGAQARKQLKPGQTYENAAAQSNNSESRRSSTSNGVASSSYRRSSIQLSKESSKDTGVVFVNSPNARGSVNGDTSGRSTPQQKSKGGSVLNDKAPTMDSATDVEMSNDDVSTSPESILKLLTDISSQWATQGSLQIARDQAEIRANRLQLEFNANHKQFGEFPAIKERKSADKQAAQKELAAVERKLSEHKASQTQSMSTLAHIIGRAIELSARTDQVSRAEYDALSRKYTELRQELDIAVKLVENQRAQLAETKSVADAANKASGEVANVQDHVTKLEKEIESVKQWKSVSEPTLREVKSYKDAVKTAQGAADHTRKQLDNIKNDVQQCQRDADNTRSQLDQLKNEARKFATNQALNKLEAQCETLDQDVAGVKKKSIEFQKDLGQIKASKVVSSVAQAHTKTTTTKPSDDDKDFQQKVAMLSERGPALWTKVEGLETELDELRNRLSDKAQEVDGDFISVRQDIDQIMDVLYEEGKEPMLQRVKNLDKVVNNLCSKIQVIQPDEKPLIQQRLSKIEQDQAGVQEDLKNLTLLSERLGKVEQSHAAAQKDLKELKTDAQAPQASIGSSSSTVNSSPVYARRDYVEEEIARLEQQAVAKDGIIVKHVAEELSVVQQQFADVDNSRIEDTTRLNACLTGLQQTLAKLDGAMANKAGLEGLSSLEAFVSAKVNELKDDVKKLQAHQQKASPATQASMLPSSGQHQYGAQIPNGIVHSPQLPNGINGSPSLQNGSAPRFSSPHGSGVAHPPPNQMQEIKRIQMELDRFVGVTQQLKQRFDNLQTDEMVRQMVDQMSQMYPHAKSFDSEVNSLRTDLAKLRAEKDAAVKQLNHLLSDAKNSSSSANAKADQAVNNASSAVTDVRRMSTELRDVKEAVARVTNTTNGVEKRSKETNELHLQNAKKEFDKQMGMTKTAIETSQSEMRVLSDRLSTCEGTIEGLKVQIKKKQ